MTTGVGYIPVQGIDGISPIRNDTINFKVWDFNEIYFAGGSGSGKFIPKVGDLVIEFTTSTLTYKRVVSIDTTTMNPTLKLLADDDTAGELGESVLMGVGPGSPNETYRVYIDKQTNPYTLSVDRRCVIPGQSTVKAKLYRGALSAGEVISKVYSSDFSVFLGDAVDLETVYQTAGTSSTYKIVPTCHTKADLVDNELITAVFYTATGNVVSKHQLLVECTDFIAHPATAVKYIMSVDLVSQFMSGGVLRFPLGLPLSSLDLMCVIAYSDGSKLNLPIDGARCALYGLSGFVSSIVGMKIPLVIKYTLQPTEVADNNSTFITKPYTLEVISTDSKYGVKLYPNLKWDLVSQRYTLRWWLMTLARDNFYDVTALVDYLPNFPYDYADTNEQEVRVKINMSDVGVGFNSYLHLQNCKVNLPIGKATSTSLTNRWTLDNDGMGDIVMTTQFAKRGTKGVIINNGMVSKDDWLKAVYYATKPMINPTTEVEPLEPTHFLIRTTEVANGITTPHSATFSIANFDEELIGLGTPVNLKDNVVIVFIYMLPAGAVSYLSIVELPFA